MKFNNIKIPQSITKRKGIKEINISRLSNIVALVGKNGSGKTRILDLLEENLFKSITIPRFFDNSISGLPKELKNLSDSLSSFKSYFLIQERIQELNLKRATQPDNKDELLNEINVLKNDEAANLHAKNVEGVKMLTEGAKVMIQDLKNKHLRRIKYFEIQQLQEVIADVAGENLVSFEKLIEKVAEDDSYDEFKTIHKSALKYLSKLPHQLTFDFIECLGEESKFEKRVSYKRFLSLKKMVKNFLNKDLTWDRKSVSNTVSENGVESTYVGIWK